MKAKSTTKRKSASSTPQAGRPRERFLDLPVYDGMEQCSAATGIPLADLKHAKRKGCNHVQYGRVHLGVFLKWFFDQLHHGDDETGTSNIDWVNRNKRAIALRNEMKLEEDRHRLIDFALVEQFVRFLEGTCFFSELDRICAEFPAVLKGKSEMEIFSECDRQRSIIKRTIADNIKAWVAKGGKL